MQNDETLWQIINKDFCAFKKRTEKADFCRNVNNVTGLCNRVSCPLANSNYGTVLERRGVCYLRLKTVERAHLPKELWEETPLPSSIDEAMKLIELKMKNLYPGHQISRCKRRLLRLRYTLVRMRKLELQPKVKYVPVKKKTDRREETREKKAEIAAKVDNAIEDELLRRLEEGVYGHLHKDLKQTVAAQKEKKRKEKFKMKMKENDLLFEEMDEGEAEEEEEDEDADDKSESSVDEEEEDFDEDVDSDVNEEMEDFGGLEDEERSQMPWKRKMASSSGDRREGRRRRIEYEIEMEDETERVQ